MFSHGVEKTNSLVLSTPNVVHVQAQGRGLSARLVRTLASAPGAWSRSLPLFVALCRANGT